MTNFVITKDEISIGMTKASMPIVKDLLEFTHMLDTIGDDIFTIEFKFGDQTEPSLLQVLAYREFNGHNSYAYLHADNEFMLSQLESYFRTAVKQVAAMANSESSMINPDKYISLKKLDSDDSGLVRTMLLLGFTFSSKNENPIILLREGELDQSIIDYMRLYCHCSILPEKMIDAMINGTEVEESKAEVKSEVKAEPKKAIKKSTSKSSSSEKSTSTSKKKATKNG